MYFQPYCKRIYLLSRVYNKWSYFSLSSSLSLCFYAFKCFKCLFLKKFQAGNHICVQAQICPEAMECIAIICCYKCYNQAS